MRSCGVSTSRLTPETLRASHIFDCCCKQQRHCSTATAMSVAPAPAEWPYAVPAPVVECIVPAPAVSYVTLAPVVEYIAPAPAVDAASTPVVRYISLAQHLSVSISRLRQLGSLHLHLSMSTLRLRLQRTQWVPHQHLSLRTAPAPAVSYTAPAPVVEYMAPAPALCSAPTPVHCPGANRGRTSTRRCGHCSRSRSVSHCRGVGTRGD